MTRVNYVEFSCGIKGSGKSHLLARRAARFPRRIILDFADEFFGVYPEARECLTFANVLDALEDVAPAEKWIVVASLMPEDVVKLCALLSPLNRPRDGYSYKVGGVLIECGEVELIAPSQGKMAPEVANLVHRGRHSRTSMVWATRRPRHVNRLVTSQCDVITCFRQQESADIDYLASLIGLDAANALATLEQWQHVQFIPSLNRASLVDPSGKELEIVNPL